MSSYWDKFFLVLLFCCFVLIIKNVDLKRKLRSSGAGAQCFTQSAFLTCQELNLRLDSGLAPRTIVFCVLKVLSHVEV